MLQKYALSLIFIAALAGLSAYAGHWATDARWSAKWAERDKTDAQAQAAAQREIVDAHNLAAAKIKEVDTNAKTKIDQAVAAAVAANRAGRELHDAATVYAAAGPTCAAGTAAERAAIATDRIVLADLFRRADQTAGELAAYADQARERGLAAQNAAKEYAALCALN